MTVWAIKPGIAAYIEVISPHLDRLSAVFLDHTKGIVIGLRNVPMKDSGIPMPVQITLATHFSTVFALEHENWKECGPSPRAQYCNALQPWTVEVPGEPT